MYKHFLIAAMAVLFFACGQAPEQRGEREDQVQMEAREGDRLTQGGLTPEERAFLDNLASLCGKSFAGEEVYLAEGRESWADDPFVMHVTKCEEDVVHIPFHVGDDTSRTWMFLVEDDGRLRFRHDHRYPDGTPEEKTMYGGYADGTGTAYAQHFPKDDYSRELLEDYFGREWRVVMDEEMTTYSYRLLYDGEVVFQADFDLTNPL